jgi:hypothetical protein
LSSNPPGDCRGQKRPAMATPAELLPRVMGAT